MPIPLIKVAMTTAKIMARPINGILKLRLKNSHKSLRTRKVLIAFGYKCISFENWSNRLLVQGEDKILLRQLDLHMVSEEAALSKGIEYFAEMLFFYGVVFSIVGYEIKKSLESSKKLR